MMRKLKQLFTLSVLFTIFGCAQHKEPTSTAGIISFDIVGEAEQREINQCSAAKKAKPVFITAYFEGNEHPQVGVGVWIKTPDDTAAYFLTNAHVVTDKYEDFNYWDEVASKNKPYMVDIIHSGSKAVEGEVVYASLKATPYKNYLNDYSSYNELSDIAIIKVDELPEHFDGMVTQHTIAETMPDKVLQVHAIYPKPKGNGIQELDTLRTVKCAPYLSDGISTYLLDEDMQVIKGQSGSPIFNKNGEIVGLIRGTSKSRWRKNHIAHLLPTHIDLPMRIRFYHKDSDKPGQLYGTAIHLDDIHKAMSNYFKR